ncbi:hypothetical protein N7516_008271 [Penicillium verrucosum]|uniref:uncharacterized protein n=1 Tax=Penicillium verrucosum TaxID=60171 RepID=UPI002544E5FA|nr:uncharacterized protein N7516_008271 [Penicillium verrucosum]KAJ5926498.1 hypothetical protein N7516_008271 [Penicillium verrucosum]
MADRKRALKSGKATAPGSPNGFTTERSVGGERRSIRHYHDGRVSQREALIPGPVQKLTDSIVTSRKNSASNSTVLKPKAAHRPKRPESEYRAPTDREIERLAGAVTNLFHPERTTPFPRPPPQEERSQSWGSGSSSGSVTPPFPVASPTPEGSPELMSTEVFPLLWLPTLVNQQWADMGGKNRFRGSDLHD